MHFGPAGVGRAPDFDPFGNHGASFGPRPDPEPRAHRGRDRIVRTLKFAVNATVVIGTAVLSHPAVQEELLERMAGRRGAGFGAFPAGGMPYRRGAPPHGVPFEHHGAPPRPGPTSGSAYRRAEPAGSRPPTARPPRPTPLLHVALDAVRRGQLAGDADALRLAHGDLLAALTRDRATLAPDVRSLADRYAAAVRDGDESKTRKLAQVLLNATSGKRGAV